MHVVYHFFCLSNNAVQITLEYYKIRAFLASLPTKAGDPFYFWVTRLFIVLGILLLVLLLKTVVVLLVGFQEQQ